MSGPGTDRPAEDRLFEEAASWFARMRGPDSESSRSEFESWLAVGQAHRSAYNRAAEIFAMGKLLGEDEALEESGKPSPGSTRIPIFATFGLLGLAAATILLILLVPGWTSRNAAHEGAQVALLTAPAGKQRLVRLADGSLVRLEGSTRVDVRFTGERRSLLLDRGAARFKVAHEGRPFVVLAGGGAVTAHGTMFEVALSKDRRVSVRLFEGSIEVSLPRSARKGGSATSRLLSPGETMSFAAAGAHGAAEPAATSSVERAGGGPADRTVAVGDYDSVRLADLVEAANRGSSRPIRIADARTGERRVSGRFRIDDTALLAERLALLFDLRIDRTSPSQIVLGSR
jgi:transmembrane sensor